MEAMTMTYRIPDKKEFEKIRQGDIISAKVYQRRFEDPYWLGNIVVKSR